MSGSVNTRGRRRGRRGRLWVFGAAVLVGALLYWEQAELIYVLSVLSLCGFLLVVAFSGLDRGGAKSDAPTAGENVDAAVEAVTVAPAGTPRRAANRRRRAAAGSRLPG